MVTLDDILKAAPRRTATYDLNGITLNLREMSVAQQEQWNKVRETIKDNTEGLYSQLIRMCCDEMKDADDAFFQKLSPAVILDIGNKIFELSSKGDDAKK